MPPSPPAPAAATPPPAFTVAQLASALADHTRWRILRELADGAPRMIVELAAAVGKRPPAISRHIRFLRLAGLVTVRQRLYSIPPRFLPGLPTGERLVDFGPCLLRLDQLA